MDEAVLARRPVPQLAQLMFPTVGPRTQERDQRCARGMNGLAGRRGPARWSSTPRPPWPSAALPRGEDVILVRHRDQRPTTCVACSPRNGILTSRGGQDLAMPRWSPAAWARTCVCGASDAAHPSTRRRRRSSGRRRGRAERGGCHLHRRHHRGPCSTTLMPVRDSAVVRAFEGDQDESGDELVAAVVRIMEHADTSCVTLRVRANADTPLTMRAPGASLRSAKASGCAAPSTCSSRTNASSPCVEALILAEGTAETSREGARGAACPCSARTSPGSWRAMDGLPVTIRLHRPTTCTSSCPTSASCTRSPWRSRRTTTGRRPEAGHALLEAGQAPAPRRTRCWGFVACRLGIADPWAVRHAGSRHPGGDRQPDRTTKSGETPIPESHDPPRSAMRRGSLSWSRHEIIKVAAKTVIEDRVRA